MLSTHVLTMTDLVHVIISHVTCGSVTNINHGVISTNTRRH